MIRVFKDINELSQYAANSFVEIASQSIAKRGRFLTALSGGNSPTQLYKLLGDSFHDQVDWTRTHFFWGDERCVPADDEGNNYGQVRKVLFDKINIPADNIHRIISELDPDSAAREYAQTLEDFSEPPLAWPRFDLVLLGMGNDGHTASLFPNSPVEINSPAIAVTANYQGRPANRVTLTPKVLNSSKNIMFLVTGKAKAETLRLVVGNKYMPKELPSQRIAPEDGTLTWLIDKDAGSLLENVSQKQSSQ
jgi:6-phosphogluconolactonase